MKSRNLKSAIWLILAVSATALAAGGPPPGKGGGGGGGGGGGEETASNNLSVPTIMVGGGSFTGVTCGQAGAWSDLVVPTGEPIAGYPIGPNAYYYVQGVHEWQAQCSIFPNTTMDVYGEWGDNLTGDAKLKVGSPIRVELVLKTISGATNYGYEVVKLEPDKLDRESAYGTLAAGSATDSAAYATLLTPLVFDGQARLVIKKADGTVVVPDALAKAEINATGKVVYGYSLRVPAAGPYEITFTVPNVNFTGCDAGDCKADTATLSITVGGGGGGGGSGNRPPRP